MIAHPGAEQALSMLTGNEGNPNKEPIPNPGEKKCAENTEEIAEGAARATRYWLC